MAGPPHRSGLPAAPLYPHARLLRGLRACPEPGRCSIAQRSVRGGRIAARGGGRPGACARHPRGGPGRAGVQRSRGRPGRAHTGFRGGRRRRHRHGRGHHQPGSRAYRRVGMSSRFGRVGVLYGGSSAEREVSLMSGRGVHEALCRAGVDAHLFDTGTHTLIDLVNAGFDRVFIALHGRYGEDGTLQGMLELMKLPYTGSGPMASSLSMDKVMTKKVWLHEGLPTPDYMVLLGEQHLDEAVDRLGVPLIVKPPHEGSTMGVTKVTDRGQMTQAYRLAARFDAAVMAEQFIEGRELTVPLLGGPRGARALPIVEIVAPGGNYDYEHKYLSDETQYVCPAALDKDLTEHIQRLAERSYEV